MYTQHVASVHCLHSTTILANPQKILLIPMHQLIFPFISLSLWLPFFSCHPFFRFFSILFRRFSIQELAARREWEKTTSWFSCRIFVWMIRIAKAAHTSVSYLHTYMWVCLCMWVFFLLLVFPLFFWWEKKIKKKRRTERMACKCSVQTFSSGWKSFSLHIERNSLCIGRFLNFMIIHILWWNKSRTKSTKRREQQRDKERTKAEKTTQTEESKSWCWVQNKNHPKKYILLAWRKVFPSFFSPTFHIHLACYLRRLRRLRRRHRCFFYLFFRLHHCCILSTWSSELDTPTSEILISNDTIHTFRSRTNIWFSCTMHYQHISGAVFRRLGSLP